MKPLASLAGALALVALMGCRSGGHCALCLFKEASASTEAGPAAAAPSTGAVSWDEVVTAVSAQLEAARTEAHRGEADAAKESVYDAYFASFEALGMETAIRENISARRAFELEEMFAELRQRLASGDLSAFEKAKERLLRELEVDARALEQARVARPS